MIKEGILSLSEDEYLQTQEAPISNVEISDESSFDTIQLQNLAYNESRYKKTGNLKKDLEYKYMMKNDSNIEWVF